MKETKNNKYQVFQPLLLSLMVVVGMLVGFKLNKDGSAPLFRVFPGEKDIRLGQVEEIIRFLESKYLFDPDSPELTEEMIRQIFSKLDPYSLYIPENELGRVNDNMNGHFNGIGIETLIFRDTLLVTNVLRDSPAEKAGIQKMDRIIGVDSIDYTGENLDFTRFRDYFRKSVRPSIIHIFRKNTNDLLHLEVKADLVKTNSVNYFFPINDSVFYVRIDQFVEETYREFMQAIESGQKENKIPALIIDVRDNPGGYLNEVTKILSQFFDESEKLLVRTKVRNGKEKVYLTTGRNFYEIGEIVILINENSASGSEVLAGALQDWDRAVIVGKRSYGKGLVQEQYNLGSGGAVRLTVANYYLPSGRSIQHAFSIDSLYFDIKPALELKDSLFTSLIRKRPLPCAVGIVPDYIIGDTLYEQELWPRLFNDVWLDEKVIDYIEENSYLLAFDEFEFRQKFVLSEKFISTCKWWKNTEPGEIPVGNDQLELLLRAKLMQYLFSDEAAVKLMLQQDPYMLMALDPHS